MAEATVLVVLTNYLRPQNMPQVIAAWRAQTVPVHIVVVDNSPLTEKIYESGHTFAEEYVNPRLEGADDVWRFKDNLGPPCRWGPALMLTGFKYVVFADDDRVPGNRALENLLNRAAMLGNRFSTFGAEGRLFLLKEAPGRKYSGKSFPKRDYSKDVTTDIGCHAHLVRADTMRHMLHMRDDLIRVHGEEGRRLAGIHDDIVMCCGIQRATEWPSYLTAVEPDPAFQLIQRRLDEGNVALWRRPGHFEDRSNLVDMCINVGWPQHLAVRP